MMTVGENPVVVVVGLSIEVMIPALGKETKKELLRSCLNHSPSCCFFVLNVPVRLCCGPYLVDLRLALLLPLPLPRPPLQRSWHPQAAQE